ncbi:transposase [Rhizobium mongolense]|uniref:Transposase n=1 Tax=Rhizobium mongolense TaxID=57676 RepID=A0A7W6WHQ0_9HYPH|nr:transposase [Rhizobium mongolense]
MDRSPICCSTTLGRTPSCWPTRPTTPAIPELIREQGATANIPPKSNRRWKPCFSRRLCRERNRIERFFSKLTHFRRVATRYDKLAANFLVWSNSPQSGCGCALMSV